MLYSAQRWAKRWGEDGTGGSVVGTGPWGAPGGRRWVTARDLAAERRKRLPPRRAECEVPPSSRLGGGEMVYALHDHQRDAIASVVTDEERGGGGRAGRSGILCVGCGGGKTVVGVGIALRLRLKTRIVTLHRISQMQWKAHFERAGLDCHAHGWDAWSGDGVPDVCCFTYAGLARGLQQHGDPSRPLDLAEAVFAEGDQLLLLDEVHCASAPTFRLACGMPCLVAVGMTGSLVREDGGVESLLRTVGPVLYECSSADLMRRGLTARTSLTLHLVPPSCRLLAVPKPKPLHLSLDPPKLAALLRLLRAELAAHRTILFCDDLAAIPLLAAWLRARAPQRIVGPVTGQVEHEQRSALVADFETSAAPCVLLISKVGNVAIDFARADALVQIVLTSRSRSECEQRIGRVSRNEGGGKKADLHTIVVRDTMEEEFAAARTAHLTAKGFYTAVVRHERDEEEEGERPLWEEASRRPTKRRAAPSRRPPRRGAAPPVLFKRRKRLFRKRPRQEGGEAA